ncbi:MAG: hypothetical protein M1819_002584 [Sarea resinae]|nr:MAG: hypothetical protein M1819_002584 [Sarea resinae]
MARGATSLREAPDPTAINLSRLLSRIDHALLSPDSWSELQLHGPKAARTKVGANLEYARSLLLRLEHETSNMKVQSRKQAMQKDLLKKREIIKRLNQRLQELGQLDGESFSGQSDSEDLLNDDGLIQQSQTAVSGLQEPERGSEALISSTQNRRSIATESFSTLRSRRPPQPNSQDTAISSATDAGLSQTAATETLLTHNRTEQEFLTNSLLSMAKALKASSAQLSESLESEKNILGRAGEGLEKNATGMEIAEKRMSTLRRMTEGKGWWGRILMYMWIAGLMMLALIIVGVLPKLRF